MTLLFSDLLVAASLPFQAGLFLLSWVLIELVVDATPSEMICM
jgi:hypothetical protein